MTIRRSRAALLAATAPSLPLTFAPVLVAPAAAQWIVYDPTNYAQNVLQAARALEQINNQITSLQNEAQMLINQARNLASLPYSSLQRLQTAHPAASRPGAEHRVRHPADRPGVSDDLRQCLAVRVRPAIDRRCAHPLAEHGRRPSGCHACSGSRSWQSRHQPRRDVCAGGPEPGRHRRASGNAGRQPDPRASRRSSLPTSPPSWRPMDAHALLPMPSARPRPNRAASSAGASSLPAPAISPATPACSRAAATDGGTRGPQDPRSCRRNRVRRRRDHRNGDRAEPEGGAARGRAVATSAGGCGRPAARGAVPLPEPWRGRPARSRVPARLG